MDLTKLSEPLPIDSIDFRVQSINKGYYATILAYKDARVDQQRLDDVVGSLNWQREHTRDNRNCIVSIWDEKKGQWVSKEDTGKESFTEAEKGLASDSFKRACFNWGIGRELYSYPRIQIKLNSTEYSEKDGKIKQSYNLDLNAWKWESKFDNNRIVFLQATDTKGNIRYTWDLKNNYQKSTNDIDNVPTNNIDKNKDIIKQAEICVKNKDLIGLTKIFNDLEEVDKEKFKPVFSGYKEKIKD